MKKTLLFVALSLGSCAHVPGPLKDFGVCLNGEIGPQVAPIIAEVESALASGSWLVLLTDLGKRVGFAVVDCAVNEVLDHSRARLAAAPSDELSYTKIVNGTDWLHRS